MCLWGIKSLTRRHQAIINRRRLSRSLFPAPLKRSIRAYSNNNTPEQIVRDDGRNSVLFVSPVWPERSSSAAGVRTCDLIDSFQQRNYAVAYMSPSTSNEHASLIQNSGVDVFQCPPNHEEKFARVLNTARPNIVIFDRFFAEEMFSFRVKEHFPDALRILDMQDVHFLREGRQQLAKKGASLEETVQCRPDTASPSCLRELASIYRSDITFVCSPVEINMLSTEYNIPSNRLILAPFFTPPSPHATVPVPWAPRRHFLMIGNFLHPPNFDSVRWSCQEIWPRLRKQLLRGMPSTEPPPELHIWGSYAPQSATQLHKPAAGVYLKGFAPSLDVMLEYRVCLAPLRYGAGLKGKIVDSWWHGLPVCTTPIGSEGMTAQHAQHRHDSGSGDCNTSEGGSWGGLGGAKTSEELIVDAARLYSDEALWEESQKTGFELLRQLYDRRSHLDAIHSAIENLLPEGRLQERRRRDFFGGMLWQQQMRATEYFSRWIELKEGKSGSSSGGGQAERSEGQN